MKTEEHRCKGCGIVFEDLDQEIDKCLKKRLYCELCLAQKNPWSPTEHRIRNRYILCTAAAALLVLGVLTALNWEKSENKSVFEFLVSFGFGYLIIWGFTALSLLPALVRMKKPWKEQIRQEKEKYVEEMETKKVVRKARQEERARGKQQAAGG
ncbi:MAG: hypothetical protein Kow0089_08550 [Desulfobulbaceae bacterium]